VTPTPDLFPSRSHTEAVDAITAALQGGASCVLVVGVSGIGKTSLCRELSGSTDERTFFTALLDSRLSVEDVLGQLLSDFGLLASPSAGGSDRERLRSAVTRFLVSLKPLGARAAVVVDDADRVGSDVLGTLHRLAVDDETQGQLRLVLVGQPSLEARLREPAFTELNALIAHRVRLTPLDRDELLPYVAHRADHGAADAAGGVLTAERLSQVFDQSEGIPARVNFFAARPAQADGEPRPAPAEIDAPAASAAESPVARPARSGRAPLVVGLLVLAIAAAAGWMWVTRAERGSASPQDAASSPAASSPGPSSPAASLPAASPPADAIRGSSAPSSPAAVAERGAAAASAGGAGSASAGTAPAGASGTGSAANTGSAPAGGSGEGRYRITVASFRTAARAEAIASQLQERKLPVTTRVDATGTWHQVLAGPYPTLEAARDVQRTLSAAGFPDTLISLPPAAPGQDNSGR